MQAIFSSKFFLTPANLKIEPENIFDALKVPLEAVDPYLESIISEFTQHALEICSPTAEYGLFAPPVFPDPVSLHLEGQIFFLERIVLSALKKSTQIALFVATCGEGVEQLSKQLLQDGHNLEGLVVDLIGSEIAEETAEFIHRQVTEDMHTHGLFTTNRYSPGYCNWPVSDQQKLFTLLKGHTAGVCLTASSLMLPIKSVSGIIGVGPDVRNKGYSCNRCNAEFCIYRDKR